MMTKTHKRVQEGYKHLWSHVHCLKEEVKGVADLIHVHNGVLIPESHDKDKVLNNKCQTEADRERSYSQYFIVLHIYYIISSSTIKMKMLG